MKFNTKSLLACTVGSAAMMMAVPTMAQDANTFEDEVIATGIRASLERGLDVKRNADSIVDAISAEELGKFPDTNVAESLQRITGVAITRSRGGEGQFVTVRGLGEEFNQLTYNNRTLATENIGREFSFDVIASELISAAQVYKSQTASQIDGSIGGLVNIETAKPLNNPGFHAAGQIATQYESLGEDFGVKASGIISNSFNNDTVGVLASIAYQQRDIRTDTAESIAIDQSADFNGDGVNDRLNSFNANINNEERERLGGTLAIQFAPNDDLEFTVDGLYTKFESPSLSSSYSYFPNPGVVSGAVVDGNNDVVSQTSNFDPANPFSNIFDFVARRAEADTDTFQIGANFKNRANETVTYELDASYSRADGVRDNIGSNNGSGSFFVVSFPGANFTQTAGGRVPNIDFTALPNVDATQTVSIDQLPADGARLHFSRNSSNEIEDEVFTLKGDLGFELDDTSKISVGAQYIDRTKSNTVFDNSNDARFCGDGNVSLPNVGPDANAFFCDRSLLFSSFLDANQLSQLLIPFNGEDEDFLASTDANIPRNFLTPNIDIVEQAFANLATQTGQPSFLDAVENATLSNQIEESTLAGYVQADFEGEFGSVPYRANAGVRAIYTDLTSTGEVSDLTFISLDPIATGGSGNNPITVETLGATSIANDYFDILPSFNIAFDVQDNLIVRAGFSRSLTRPTFNDLRTTFSVDQINEGQEQSSGGDPQLEAVRSNNVDLSAEWYGDNGLSVTGAVFYKDISDFITNANTLQPVVVPNGVNQQTGEATGPVSVPFLFSGPQNGDSAEIYGLELAAQQLFDNGFGVSGNLTLADSSSTSGGVSAPLENISDFSFNGSVFYEANGIQARASVNHRGEYLSSTQGEGGFAEFTDDFTQVDLSLSYDVNDNFTVFGEGQNVLNEQLFVFSERNTFLESFIDNGSRWIVGVRGNF